MKSSINFKDLELKIPSIRNIENKKIIGKHDTSNHTKIDNSLPGLYLSEDMPRIDDIYRQYIIICREGYISLFGKIVPFEIINPYTITIHQLFGKYIIFIDVANILTVISINDSDIYFFSRDNSISIPSINKNISNNYFIQNSKNLKLLFNNKTHTIVKTHEEYSLKIGTKLAEISSMNPFIILADDYEYNSPYIYIIYNSIHNNFIYICYKFKNNLDRKKTMSLEIANNSL
jgi:hypothetical protein